MFYFFYIVYILFKYYNNYQLTSNIFSNLCDLILISDNKNILEDCIINDEWIVSVRRYLAAPLPLLSENDTPFYGLKKEESYQI